MGNGRISAKQSEILEYIKLEKAYREERKRYYNFKKMYSKFYS